MSNDTIRQPGTALTQLIAAYEPAVPPARQRLVPAGTDLSHIELTGVKLPGVDLREVNLAHAILTNAQLANADLSGVDLHNASLAGATLQGAVLNGANLAGAEFAEADLRSAVFDSHSGCFGDCSLAGANLDGAQNAKYLDCEARLKTLSSMADAYTKTLTGMFTALAYAAITVLGMTDDRLIPNSAITQLPLLTVQVPAAMFFVIAPLVLLVFFTYVQTLYSSFRAGLEELPAILPNGLRPESAFSPWLLRPRAWRLSRWRDAGARRPMLGTRVTTAIARWAAVLCIAIFWFRYLPVHNIVVTRYHLVLLAVAAALAELDAGRPLASLASVRGKFGYIALFAAIGAAAFFSGRVSRGDVVWPVVNANFVHREVSARSTTTGTPSAFSHRIDMVGLNLAHAAAHDSSLAGADLDGADLRMTDFSSADLTGARFADANLSGARFNYAHLADADLADVKELGAIFSGADFTRAKLKHLNFSKLPVDHAVFISALLDSAQFDDANDLSRVDFTSASLTIARFAGSDLTGAIFRNAHLRSATFLSGNDTLTGIDFSGADLTGATFAGNPGANLEGVNFCGAILRDAVLSHADLSKATGLTYEQLSAANTEGAILPGGAKRLADVPKAVWTAQVAKCGK